MMVEGTIINTNEDEGKIGRVVFRVVIYWNVGKTSHCGRNGTVAFYNVEMLYAQFSSVITRLPHKQV